MHQRYADLKQLMAARMRGESLGKIVEIIKDTGETL